MGRLGKSVRNTGLLALLAAAILIPLYGDPRSTPVTHSEWARMLLRAVEMEDVFAASTQASIAFSLLSWRESLSFGPDQYFSAHNVSLVREGNRAALTASEGTGLVDYRLAVLRSGEYRIRARLRGDPAKQSSTEIMAVGAGQALGSFPVTPPAESAWLDIGSTHLDRGKYDATLSIPADMFLERVEFAPPCLNPIEPLGGWRALALASPADVAVTAIKALNAESELAPAAVAFELKGSDLMIVGGDKAIRPAVGLESTWIKAGRGARATLTLELPEEGLYTLSVYGIEGRGQRWLADGCQKKIVCPPARPTEAQWHPVLTARFTAGRHLLTVTLGGGAVVQRVRVERKRDAAEDYVGALNRLGFDVGTTDPIPRRTAIDAMNFIRQKRRQLGEEESVCGDVLEAELLAGQEGGGHAADGGAGPGPLADVGAGTAPTQPHIGTGGEAPPPVVPPQLPASPTTP